MKILLVDDDVELVEMLTHVLRRKGHSVQAANTASDALESWNQEDPSLVILDVGLPGESGLDVCSAIRARSDVPVMLMSGASTEDDVIRGFQAGADDYIFKPFSITQLHLRIEAMTRRVKVSAVSDYEGNIRLGDLVINPEYYSVQKNGRQVQLTRMEFRVLYCLAANAGRVVVIDKLADFAWQGEGEGDPVLLKTHISRLRRKLAGGGKATEEIRALPGLGYSLSVAG